MGEGKLNIREDYVISVSDTLSEEYLLKNYQRKITLDDLARETYFSKSYLSRYISRQFGTNFYALLTDVRLQHAEKDLHHKDRSITRVSMDNGFSTVNSLNRSFREKYGMTPSEYRGHLQEERQEKQEAENGVLQLSCTLNPNAIASIHIYYRSGKSI